MKAFGLTAVAVNSTTKSEVDAEGGNIWKHVESETTVILISPEMLSTPGFGTLINSKIFQARLFAIAVDEVHLLWTWGEEFRPAYRQIGFIRARFSKRVRMLAMTATLQKKNMSSICNLLGMNETYHLVRRSNARPDIRLVFRTFNATQSSDNFPQLEWIMKEKKKTLIFCPTIRFGFKLAVYFWHLDPHTVVRRVTNRSLRLFNSLNSVDHNRQTLELLEDSGASEARITIATDKLSVGVDVSDFQTVVVIDPKDLDDLWQKGGRVGRDKQKVKNACVIVYIPSRIMKEIMEDDISHTSPVDAQRRPSKRKRSKKIDKDGKLDPSKPTVDPALRNVICAQCHVAALDVCYENPKPNPSCSQACLSCHPPAHTAQLNSTELMDTCCTCGACQPEVVVLEEAGSGTQKPRKRQVALSIRITKHLREIGHSYFAKIRRQFWANADEATTGMLPRESFLPNTIIDSLLDNFVLLLTKDSVRQFMSQDCSQVADPEGAHQLLKPFLIDLPSSVQNQSCDILQAIWNLHNLFDQERERKKDERKAIQMHSQAAKQVMAELVDEDPREGNESESDSGDDFDKEK